MRGEAGCAELDGPRVHFSNFFNLRNYIIFDENDVIQYIVNTQNDFLKS